MTYEVGRGQFMNSDDASPDSVAVGYMREAMLSGRMTRERGSGSSSVFPGGGGPSFGAGLGVGGGGNHGRDRGGIGILAGLAKLSQLGPHQRQLAQQRKHPEPLRRAVANCLSASYNATTSSFVSEAVRTLQDYLANSATMDSAYIVLLEHASAERDRSPPVISKCVALLKRYLFRYVPRPNTLEQIAAFCEGLIAECEAAGITAGRKTNPEPSSEQSVPGNQGPTATLPFASGSLVKSLFYVRALVARCFAKYPYHHSSNLSSAAKPLKPALPSPRTRPFTSPYERGLKRAVTDDREAVKSAAMCIAGLENIDDEDTTYLADDIFKWRWLGLRGQPSWAPSPVMMDSGGIARPHVARIQNLAEQGASSLMLRAIQQKDSGRSDPEGITQQLILPATATAGSDKVAVRSHLRAVAAAKRYKSNNSQRCEQQPLRMSDADMEEVINAVCSETASPSGNTAALLAALPSNHGAKVGPEAADVAASVLIKLLIDMYLADPRTAAPLTLSMLQGMLASPSTWVRIRAFDLALNLGVHAHLLEPMQSEDQTTLQQGLGSEDLLRQNASFATFGALSGLNKASDRRRMNKSHHDVSSDIFLEKPERGTPPAVGRFETWLLDIVCEMLLFLVQSEEAEEGVWAAGLSCLLFLVCDRGRILRRRLDGLDVRALRMLLDISWEYGWAEEVHSRLVCVLCNLLYRPLSTNDELTLNKATLNLEQLELVGGVETLCQEYARVQDLEAKRNLFAVLFDFSIVELEKESAHSQKQFAGTEEIQAIASALSLAEAPECYALAFKQGLPGVGEALSESISTAMARDVTSGRLNAQFLEDIVRTLDNIVAIHTRPVDEFMQLLPLTLANDGLNVGKDEVTETVESTSVSKAWATLEFLLHSTRPCYRHSGYAWLLELLQAEMARGSSWKSNSNALQRQLGLLGKGENPTVGGVTVEDLAAETAGAETADVGIENLNNDEPAPTFTEKTDPIPTRSSAVRLMCGLLKSKRSSIRRGFMIILERVLLLCQKYGCDLELNPSSVSNLEVRKPETAKNMGPQDRALALLSFMNGALWQVISANDTDRVNIIQMCNLMFSQIFVRWPVPTGSSRSFSSNGRGDTVSLEKYGSQREGVTDSMTVNRITNGPSNGGSRSSSVASMFLKGHAATPKLLVASIPTPILYWPLMLLAGTATEDTSLGVAVGSRGGGCIPGGACDVRAVLVLVLIGKCAASNVAMAEVGEDFFRTQLDDVDARVAYYTSAFLLKRMVTEDSDKYQRMLHNLVFKAQQSNNEKLLENPYLQMRGILQLSSECDSPSSQLES